MSKTTIELRLSKADIRVIRERALEKVMAAGWLNETLEPRIIEIIIETWIEHLNKCLSAEKQR